MGLLHQTIYIIDYGVPWWLDWSWFSLFTSFIYMFISLTRSFALELDLFQQGTCDVFSLLHCFLTLFGSYCCLIITLRTERSTIYMFRVEIWPVLIWFVIISKWSHHGLGYGNLWGSEKNEGLCLATLTWSPPFCVSSSSYKCEASLICKNSW